MVEVPKRAFQPLTGTRHGVRQIPKYCEEFLAGIVPDAALAALLDDLGGTGWKDPDIERRLKERLRKSFNSYFETITDLNEVVNISKEKLELGDGSSVCNNMSISSQVLRAQWLLR
jgi:hypothetical protein